MGFEREAYGSDKQVIRADVIEAQPQQYAYAPPSTLSPGPSDGAHYSAYGMAPPIQEEVKRAEICGMPRKAFFLILSIVLVVCISVILGLGIGLGVGLSNMNKTAATSTAASTISTLSQSSSSLNTQTSTTPTTMVTSTTSATVAAASSVATGPTCPSANSTIVNDGGLKFLVLCNTDLVSPIKNNLAKYTQPTFDACISQCAGLQDSSKDVSAVWYRQNDPQNECWCISGTSPSDNTTAIISAGVDAAWIQT